MDEPLVGREYRLTCRDGDRVRYARFIRFEDGSGMVAIDGQQISFELDQTSWRRHWSKLKELGYAPADAGS